MNQTTDLQYAPPSNASPAAFGLPTILRALFDRWRLILSATIVTGLILFAISFLLRDTYQATAIVIPPDRTSSSLSMLGAAAGSSGSSSISSGALAALSMKNPADLYVALMSSPGVERIIVQRFELQKLYKVKHPSQARKEFERHSEIKA